MSNKEYQKMWYIKNKDKVKERNKKWRLENEDKIKENNKKWYLENQDKVKEYQKMYRLKNQIRTLNDNGLLIKKFSEKEIKDISQKMFDRR